VTETDPVEKAVVQALIKQAAIQARLDAGELAFDMSDSVPVFKKLVGETDTGIAIITAAYFDDCLGRLFSLRIDGSNNKMRDEILEFNGPLGTFSSRISLAAGLKFVTQRTYRRVNTIRKIRNEFAHNPFGVSFNSKKIKDWVVGIDVNHKEFFDLIRKDKNVRTATKQPSRLTMKEMFLVKSSLALAYMVSEMIAMPAASQNRVPAREILSDYQNLPENLKDVRRNAARCILEIFKSTNKKRI
jgi:DNA-binding MltR family transcriptional regulator